MPSAEGNLDWKPLADHPELVAHPVAQASHRVPDARVAEIDEALADTAAFCERYDVALEASANCVIVFGRRGDVINRYTNGQLTSAEVLLELWRTAEEIASEARRGEQFDPPLGTDELAVYDAVAANDSAMEVLGQPVLGQIARELVEMLRRDAKTDWTVRDDVRASIRAKIKRLLRKYKYPPDRSEEAVKLVVQQMEVLSRG